MEEPINTILIKKFEKSLKHFAENQIKMLLKTILFLKNKQQVLLRSEMNIFGSKKAGSLYTIKLRGNIHTGEGDFSLDIKFMTK